MTHFGVYTNGWRDQCGGYKPFNGFRSERNEAIDVVKSFLVRGGSDRDPEERMSRGWVSQSNRISLLKLLKKRVMDRTGSRRFGRTISGLWA